MKNRNVKLGFLNLLVTIAFIGVAILELSDFALLPYNLQVFDCCISKELEASYTIRNAYVSAEGSPRKVRLKNRQTGIF